MALGHFLQELSSGIVWGAFVLLRLQQLDLMAVKHNTEKKKKKKTVN